MASCGNVCAPAGPSLAEGNVPEDVLYFGKYSKANITAKKTKGNRARGFISTQQK
jgi:hypothetical protein